MLFINGNLFDSKAVAGGDATGEIRRYQVTLKPNDIVDLALTPAGPTDDRHDRADGSASWFWIDTRPPVSARPTIGASA